jgi:hypothetical protein
MTGVSLDFLVEGVAKACRESADVTLRDFATRHYGPKHAKARASAVKGLLHSFDKDRNGAVSFAEFMNMLQKKPWSVLLQSVIAGEESVSIKQVEAIANGDTEVDADLRNSLRGLFDEYDIDGSLELRSGLPGGRACCFRGCDVPDSWQVPKVMWCYEHHMRASVGL